MSAIIDVKCVLTQKALDAFCNKCHIPEEVHPILPNQNDTMHERPARKIRLYTRFFDFANFRLPLSTFLIDALRHFHINISQLSLIGAAKVSHFEILRRVYGIVPTVGLFRCFYVNSKKSGWMSFSKCSDNAHLAVLFLTIRLLCAEMDIFAFIHTSDPTKVKIVLRERNEGEPLLLETTIGRTIPLLPVAPDRVESELEACVERLFDEGGSGNQTEQGDSIGDVKDANIQPVNEAANTVIEDVAPVQPKRQGKRKSVVVDAVCITTRSRLRVVGDSSLLHKYTGGWRSYDSVAGTQPSYYWGSRRNLLTISPSPFFAGSSSAGGTDLTTGVFSDLTGSDFFVGDIRIVIDLDTDL
ncbi:hypothetical protein Tco_0944340 [Tanacetum coccineum]